MFRKIGKWLGLKKYCKYCIYWVQYIEALDGYHWRSDKAPDDGRNICSKSFVYIQDEIGDWKLKTHDNKEICECCDQIVHEKKQIIYDKCLDKNRRFQCKDFKAKWYFKIFF